MKLVRLISTLAFYLARIIAAGYILTACYIVISVVLHLSVLQHLPDDRFAICYPFTSKHFLLGAEYSVPYIMEMVLIIFAYGVFFWLLSDVFKTFRQKKLFTLKGVHHLKLFYFTNLMIYPFLFLFLSFYSKEDYPFVVIIAAHAIMGIFALFIAAIFEQGLNLQNDQDLII